MRRAICRAAIVAMIAVVGVAGCRSGQSRDDANTGSGTGQAWQREFNLSQRTLVPTGRSKFFILEPGFQCVFEGDGEKLAITVLAETRVVDGVTTRLVEEREWKDGRLAEVSRNFFAMDAETKDVFYFGEEVDDYKDGKVVGHGGAWLAGENDARAGLIMPGEPRLRMRYYQEIAPGVAMDRAEVVSLDATLKTPAGTFTRCLKTKEGTALNPLEKEFKTYAPGIGLIQDADLLLTSHGFVQK